MLKGPKTWYGNISKRSPSRRAATRRDASQASVDPIERRHVAKAQRHKGNDQHNRPPWLKIACGEGSTDCLSEAHTRALTGFTNTSLHAALASQGSATRLKEL